jgi:hypothetical protein
MKKTTLLLIFLITFLHSCNADAQNMMKQKEFVKAFISDYNTYGMDIQSAGIATIPVASASENGTLYIEYAYTSEGEKRNGKMTLLLNSKTKRFEGGWKTIADNGNEYQGNLCFIFERDGQANGFYQFGATDYKIKIFKR